MSWAIEYYEPLRAGAAVFLLVTFSVWEALAPSLIRRRPRAERWFANFGLQIVGSILSRLILPLGAVSAALASSHSDAGLLHQWELPLTFTIPFSLLTLDLALYLQHRLFHSLPVLWRLHRVHHADMDVDASTALRFHPLELLLSLAIKFAIVYSMGAPPVAVLAFELILNGAALFNHANMSLGVADRVARVFLVTPDMHRVHHSVRPEEMASNFGFHLSVWDRLFATYKKEARSKLVIGLLNQHAKQSLWRLLLLPFRKS